MDRTMKGMAKRIAAEYFKDNPTASEKRVVVKSGNREHVFIIKNPNVKQ